MKNKENRSPWLIRILSLFFAILLYYNANSLTLSSNNPNQHFNNLEATAENVPVNVTYNQEKYFISGFEDTVQVDLTSSNKILLDKESNAETRGFSVVMDLTKYGEGHFDVPLEIIGLPKSIQATIEPDILSVVIEKRQTNAFKVEGAVDSKIYADGYETESIVIDPPVVNISGAESSIKEIDRVIAGISDKSNITGNFSEKVKPYAINKDGEPLNVTIDPETVSVQVGVTVPSKRVRVTPIQSGIIPKGIKDYTFSIQNDMVDLEGPKEILDEINGIDLKIDTTNIRETMSSFYVVVVPRGVKANPESVFVTIKPNEVSTDKSSVSKK